VRQRRFAKARLRASAFLRRLAGAGSRGGASLARRLRRAAPLIAILALLTVALDYGGWLRSTETAALDTFLFLREPLEAKHVVIVGINRDDHRKYFGERSPLDPAELQKIIEGIARGRPAVIGVSLNTSHEVFRGMKLPASPPTVVWARDAERLRPPEEGEAEDSGRPADKSVAEVGKEVLQRALPFIFKPEEARFSVSNVLGGDGNKLPSGVALVQRDSDGAVRRYRRRFRTWEPDAPVMPSFPWAVIQEYAKRTGRALKEEEETGEGWVMNFPVNDASFSTISLSRLKEVWDGAGWGGEQGFVKDKIVLLGALYPASRDQHYTPDGVRYGVELFAHAVETELQGRTLKPPRKFTVWLTKLLVGFALVLVHTRLTGRAKKLRYTLAAVPLLALLASFFVFSSLALWSVFLPVLLAALIQQLHEDLQDYRKEAARKLYGETQAPGGEIKYAPEPPVIADEPRDAPSGRREGIKKK